MADSIFRPGLIGRISFVIKPEHLAPALGSGDARVFATPMLVAGIEAAACAVTRPRLPPEQTTVGTHINIYHRAASPLGMKVTFEATLASISPNGRALLFRVRAFDAAGDVGEGEHERVIVNLEKFEASAAVKLKN